MIVYVAVRGEEYEGGDVLGVFARKDGAVERCLSEIACFGDWKKQRGKDVWMSGCDVVSVETHEVIE